VASTYWMAGPIKRITLLLKCACVKTKIWNGEVECNGLRRMRFTDRRRFVAQHGLSEVRGD
jgi:hypothetical protein